MTPNYKLKKIAGAMGCSTHGVLLNRQGTKTPSFDFQLCFVPWWSDLLKIKAGRLVGW
jgi:hypothetical protein